MQTMSQGALAVGQPSSKSSSLVIFKKNSEKYVLKLDKWIINNSTIAELVGERYALYPCNSDYNCER